MGASKTTKEVLQKYFNAMKTADAAENECRKADGRRQAAEKDRKDKESLLLEELGKENMMGKPLIVGNLIIRAEAGAGDGGAATLVVERGVLGD